MKAEHFHNLLLERIDEDPFALRAVLKILRVEMAGVSSEDEKLHVRRGPETHGRARRRLARDNLEGNAIRGIAQTPTALTRLRLALAGAVAMANADR